MSFLCLGFIYLNFRESKYKNCNGWMGSQTRLFLWRAHQTLEVFEQSFHFLDNQIFHQILKEYFQVMFPIRNNTRGRSRLKYQKRFCSHNNKNNDLDA